MYFRYMYYQKTCFEGDTVLGVFYAAKKYMIPALERECKEFIDKQLRPNNVCPVLEQVYLAGFQEKIGDFFQLKSQESLLRVKESQEISLWLFL